MSSEPEPLPLDYRPPQPPPRRRHGGWRGILMFLAGLAAGSVVSLLVWKLGWNRFENTPALAVVPATKALVATALFFIPGWRTAGAGILMSIVIGGLIWFSQCAANFNI